MDEHETRSYGSGLRRRLLFLGRLLLHLGCLGYNLYLIWLLAHLKDNPYYWFFSFIPGFLNFLFPFFGLIAKMNLFKDSTICKELIYRHQQVGQMFLHAPSLGVVFNLIACFTMLTRVAYYHRQPDEFIGPRFIISSLQGSIVLIVLDFFLQRELNMERLLNFKDALTRALLDFVDIFNMIEILSLNECVGVGSFVSEESSTEKAIQAFCTMSFFILLYVLDMFMMIMNDRRSKNVQEADDAQLHKKDEILYGLVLCASFLFQNLPFLVIRIVVWARYKYYSLGFLVKNVSAIILFVVCMANLEKKSKQDHQLETPTT